MAHDSSNQRGAAMMMVMGLMLIAVPLVAATLSLASVMAIDSNVTTGIMEEQYGAIGASEHLAYRLLYEDGYSDGLTSGVEDTYTLDLNGQQVDVSVTKLSEPPTEPPPPVSDSSRKLRTLKTVLPTSTAAFATTTFDYAIQVENWNDKTEKVNKIIDGLPPGFAYVPGSTAGITTDDPTIVVLGGGGEAEYQKLTWNLSPNPNLDPGERVDLSFSAIATVDEGNYCNTAWADPGGTKTGTGPTARIMVGSPTASTCPGEAAGVTKTVVPNVVPANAETDYAYIISIENTGTNGLSVSKVRDLLPEGFSYAVGSVSGDITLDEPNSTMHQGRERLDWNLSPPVVISSGQTATLGFDADAIVVAGDYPNEVWVTIDELTHQVYSWPTAVVQVMGTFEASATDAGTGVSSEIWVGSDAVVVAEWEVQR